MQVHRVLPHAPCYAIMRSFDPLEPCIVRFVAFLVGLGYSLCVFDMVFLRIYICCLGILLEFAVSNVSKAWVEALAVIVS